jgi:hypothetical protein
MSAGRSRTGPGAVKVLVADLATQGSWSGDHSDCIDGELCWVLPPCANDPRGCDCWSELQGASSGGRTTTARVAVLRGTTRTEILRTLRDAATPLVGPVLAQRSAETTLAAAAAFRPGTFVRRDARGLRSQFCDAHQREFESGEPWNGMGEAER